MQDRAIDEGPSRFFRPVKVKAPKKKRLYVSRVNLYPTEIRLAKYNLKQSDYDRMYIEQGGSCAICQNDSAPLLIDHDHHTGNVRALLCSPCNGILGFAGDNPAILRKAIAYLAYFEEQQALR